MILKIEVMNWSLSEGSHTITKIWQLIARFEPYFVIKFAKQVRAFQGSMSFDIVIANSAMSNAQMYHWTQNLSCNECQVDLDVIIGLMNCCMYVLQVLKCIFIFDSGQIF